VARGAATFALVRALQRAEPRVWHRIPASFVTLALLTLVAYLLDLGEGGPGGLGQGALRLVRDIQPVARELPSPVLPTFDLTRLGELLGAALIIGLLGGRGSHRHREVPGRAGW